MTPEPDIGFRAESGFKDFMFKYGSTERGKRNCRLFNGVHVAGVRSKKSGLRLEVDNWSASEMAPHGAGDPTLMLRTSRGPVVDVAGWSAAKLEASWLSKHAKAVYVETTKETDRRGAEYFTFGPTVHVGVGTTYEHLVRAVSRQRVVYDPGDALRHGVERRRSQWRLVPQKGEDLSVALRDLYVQFETFGI